MLGRSEKLNPVFDTESAQTPLVGEVILGILYLGTALLN